VKPLKWAPGTRKAIGRMPKEVKAAFGHALNVATFGGKADTAKPLRGIGSGVLEVVEDHDGNTYRAVYTAKLKRGVYVLHVFQKKSKTGIATPKQAIELIRERLKWAMQADNGTKP
jgi:phage-related protein